MDQEKDNLDLILYDKSYIRPDVLLIDASFPDIEFSELGELYQGNVVLLINNVSEDVYSLTESARHGVSIFLNTEVSTLREFDNAITAAMNKRPYCHWPPERMSELITILASEGAPIHKKDSTEVTLTRREKEILTLLRKRLSNQEIAKRLHLSLSTVKNHVHNILHKLNFTSRYDVV